MEEKNSTPSSYQRKTLKLCDYNSYVLKRESDSAPEASQVDPFNNMNASGLKTPRKGPKLQIKLEPGHFKSLVDSFYTDVCFEGKTQ